MEFVELWLKILDMLLLVLDPSILWLYLSLKLLNLCIKILYFELFSLEIWQNPLDLNVFLVYCGKLSWVLCV